MKILGIDVGGTHLKVSATCHKRRREIPSVPKMTARKMVIADRKLIAEWHYEAVTIGYAGIEIHGHIVGEPHNPGQGMKQWGPAADPKIVATYPAADVSVGSIGDLRKYNLAQLLKPVALNSPTG